MIKCCIFDLDGTLLDTLTTITYYVNLVFERHGIDTLTNEECKKFVGSGAENLIRRALEYKGVCDGDRAVKILAEYVNEYDRNPLHLTTAFPGIEETLLSLKAKGIKLTVLSNKPDSAVKNIVASFFPNIFDAVYGQINGVPMKPEPSMANRVIGDMGASNSETAFIGDTEIDILTGKNLGVGLNIGVLWGFRGLDELKRAGADTVVSSAQEILSEITAVN